MDNCAAPVETKENAEPEGTLLGKAFRVLSYPISAFVGFSFAKPVILDATYDNLKRYETFRNIRPAHHAERREVIAKYQRGEPVNVLEETVKLNKTYEGQLSKVLDDIGLGTIDKKWRFIDKSQRQSALLTGFAAAGICIGALLTIANSKTFTVISSRATKTDGPEI